jgi:hypothetical protein
MDGMSGFARNGRRLVCVGGTLLAISLGACGGGSGGGTSEAATVGACIDAGKQVVDCSSSSAAQKLVSDQSAKDAIACIKIGSNPQVEVKVGDGTFCAEKN